MLRIMRVVAWIACVLSLSMQAAADENPLVKLDLAFRAAYSKARDEQIRRVDPILLYDSDRFLLLHHGTRTETSAACPLYDNLKSISHIPLALYALLRFNTDLPLDDVKIQDLSSFREKIVAARAAFPMLSLTPLQLSRQEEFVGKCLAFLDGAVARRACTAEELTAFTRAAAPYIWDNVADATRAKLEVVNAQVLAFKKKLTPQEWDRLCVVIQGAAMPRKGALAVQYFSKVLGQTGEGRRIIYAESLFEERRALNLLGTVEFDGGLSVAFFDDPDRMYRDLLADATTQILKECSLGK